MLGLGDAENNLSCQSDELVLPEPPARALEDHADHQVTPAIGVCMQRRELMLDQVAEGIAEVTD